MVHWESSRMDSMADTLIENHKDLLHAIMQYLAIPHLIKLKNAVVEFEFPQFM